MSARAIAIWLIFLFVILISQGASFYISIIGSLGVTCGIYDFLTEDWPVKW